MKIYAFSGLGADQRIFSYLQLNEELVPIQWIDPFPNESLSSYSLRLAEQIDTDSEFALLGVSFGGMLVSELSHSLSPSKTILISSAATRYELPWMSGPGRKWNLAQKIPTAFFKPPQFTTYFGFPFNKQHRKVAQGIIKDTDPSFVQWALGAIVRWENERVPTNMLHIHGRLDPILPLKKRMNAVVIGRGHFIILKKAKTLSASINDFLKS
jgi:pimeloyl-ACP methyl ester carboxylesterase